MNLALVCQRPGMANSCPALYALRTLRRYLDRSSARVAVLVHPVDSGNKQLGVLASRSPTPFGLCAVALGRGEKLSDEQQRNSAAASSRAYRHAISGQSGRNDARRVSRVAATVAAHPAQYRQAGHPGRTATDAALNLVSTCATGIWRSCEPLSPPSADASHE
jgi:hypothetical protein